MTNQVKNGVYLELTDEQVEIIQRHRRQRLLNPPHMALGLLDVSDVVAQAEFVDQATLRVELLRQDEPWPLVDVVGKLAQAADHLLRDCSWDGHGHEEIAEAKRIAESWLAKMAAPDGSREVCAKAGLWRAMVRVLDWAKASGLVVHTLTPTEAHVFPDRAWGEGPWRWAAVRPQHDGPGRWAAYGAFCCDDEPKGIADRAGLAELLTWLQADKA